MINVNKLRRDVRAKHYKPLCMLIVLDYLDQQKVMLEIPVKKKKNNVVLRTRKRGIDVSEVAKKFGGGGHPGAASFVWKGHMQKLFHRNP